MISERYAKKYCKEDISNIENYSKAIADDTQIWHCHHRRETIYTKEGLIEIGEYYNRPACELIFMTDADHMSLHHKGKQHALGKHWNLSEEQKSNISVAVKEAMNNPEVIKKMMAAAKGRNLGTHWFNNGVKQVRAKECPEGYGPGRLM